MFKKPTIIYGAINTRYPELNTISEGTWNILFMQYSQMPNIPSHLSEKYIGLKSLELDDERIDKMCKPIEYDEEEMNREVGQAVLKEHKMLRKWDKERRDWEERERQKYSNV